MSTTPLTKKELRKLADIYVNSLTEDPNLLGNMREEDAGRNEWVYLSPLKDLETAESNGHLRVKGYHDVVDYETDTILATLQVTLLLTRAS